MAKRVDRSYYTELNETIYNDLLEKNQVVVSRYLKLEPYPRNSGIYGFSGWDKNKIKNKYRVWDTDHGKFLSTWYAQFLGEAFFRFTTVVSSMHKNPGGGSFRKYIVQADLDGESQLLYMVPASNTNPYINKALECMTDEDCQEYVWRLHRGQWGQGQYLIDCYYHEENIPKVNRKEFLSEERMKILMNETGKTDWLQTPGSTQLDKKTKELLGDDRTRTVVQHLKDKIIWKRPHIPEYSHYISWLTELGGLKPVEAKIVYDHRDYFRLP